jgi:hypothetical protein
MYSVEKDPDLSEVPTGCKNVADQLNLYPVKRFVEAAIKPLMGLGKPKKRLKQPPAHWKEC